MDTNTRSTYLFLEFNGKLQPDILSEKLFLRVANLHKPHPLVQVNELTFRGTYENCIGTNLFFDELKDPPITQNVFKPQSPINLGHYVTLHKVINLKQVKQAKKNLEEPTEPPIKINLKWNYKTLLQKFEDGSLSLDLLEVNEHNPSNEPEVPVSILEANAESESVEPNEESPNDKQLTKIASKNILEYKYQRLKEIARRPVKRIVEVETVAECDPKYKSSYELHNLKCQIQQPPNSFFEQQYPINENTLSNAVDIDRCVLYGILEPSEAHPRILTNKEKNIVLSLDNFDNLSIPARYYVIKLYLKNLEEYVENCPKQELNKTDEFGRTPQETLNIYRELVKSLSLCLPRQECE